MWPRRGLPLASPQPLPFMPAILRPAGPGWPATSSAGCTERNKPSHSVSPMDTIICPRALLSGSVSPCLVRACVQRQAGQCFRSTSTLFRFPYSSPSLPINPASLPLLLNSRSRFSHNGNFRQFDMYGVGFACFSPWIFPVKGPAGPGQPSWKWVVSRQRVLAELTGTIL